MQASEASLSAGHVILQSWKFFKRRIAIEEDLLLSFFGDQYNSYSREVPCLIPFA